MLRFVILFHVRQTKERKNGRRCNKKGLEESWSCYLHTLLQVTFMRCSNCSFCILKGKAIKHFIVRNMVINAAVWDIDEVSVYPWGNIFSIYLYTSVCVFCNMIRLLRRHSIEYVIFPNSYIKTKKKIADCRNCCIFCAIHSYGEAYLYLAIQKL